MKINLKHLRAASCTMAQGHPKVSLNGVFVDKNILVSTNGAALSAFKEPRIDKGTCLPPFIIPCNAVTAILKAGACEISEVIPFESGIYEICGVMFLPVAEKYPEWRRVFQEVSEDQRFEIPQFDANQLMLFYKIAKILKKKTSPQVRKPFTGHSFRVVIKGLENEFIGCISPMTFDQTIEAGNFHKEC